MPIFEEELLGSNVPNDKTIPDAEIRSIDSPEPIKPGSPINPNFILENPPETLGDLAMYRKGVSFGGFQTPQNTVSDAVLEEKKRFPTYQPGVDLEDIYGKQQSAWEQWGNSLVKFVATAGAIFVEGFAAIPNTLDAIAKQDFSELSGDEDGFEGSIDRWLKNLENTFPNYYTQQERNSPWVAAIPFAPGSANFWGDKFLKNLGFTVGAISSALVQDAVVTGLTGGTGTTPLVAGQVGKFALRLNKVASTFRKGQVVANIGKMTNVGDKTYTGIKALESMADFSKIKSGAQFMTTMFGASVTEAGVESREGYRQISEDLTKEYYLSNGVAPSGADAELIDRVATDAMNIRFGVNAGILMASNSLLFGNLARNIGRAGKPIAADFKISKGPLANLKSYGLKEGSVDVFERKAVTGIANKAWDRIKPVLPVMISEGVYEEGGQFATEKGTYDYFTRKYKNLNNPNNREAWNTVEESITSIMHGLDEQFTTDEGLQNMFIGALTGMFVNGTQTLIDKKNKTDKNTRTDKVINMLNENYLTGIFKQQYEDTAGSTAIVKEMQEAAKAGDSFKYSNLQHDNFFNFVNARSKVGAHEVTLQQLQLLKELDKEQFEATFGVELDAQSRKTVSSYVDQLIEEANTINKTIEKLDKVYVNPFKWETNPETPEQQGENVNHLSFENWKKEVAYLNSKVTYFDSLKQEANNNIAEMSPALTGEIVANLMNRQSLKDISLEYEQEAASLESSIDFATDARSRSKVRKQIKKFKTLAGQASILANNMELAQPKQRQYFKSLLDFENSGRDIDNDVYMSDIDANEILNQGLNIARANDIKQNIATILTDLTSESGFKKYLESEKDVQEQVKPEDKEQVNYTNEAGKVEPLELGREYQKKPGKPLNYKKLPDGTFEVPKPDGTTVKTKTEAQAKRELDDTNSTINNMDSVIILAIMPNGSVKVEDSNGDIYDIDPSRLKGYTKVQSTNEFVEEIKDDITKAEEQAGLDAASILNKTILEPFSDEGGRRKDEQWLFLSSTTDSQTEGDELTSPHITRSRLFLQNFKTFADPEKYKLVLVTSKHVDDLGLSGIVEQSYKGALLENYLDPEQGWMAVVMVKQEVEKGEDVRYFVDQEGNKLGKVGESADLNKVIYQTVPTVDLYYKNGRGPKFRKTQEAEATHRQKQWTLFRKNYFEDGTVPEVLDFEISKGIGKVSNQKARNSIEHLVPASEISTNPNLIQIPTTGFIEFQDRSLSVPSGVPLLQYKDVLEYLQNRKLNKKEAEVIYELLDKISKNILTDLNSFKKPSLKNDEWDFIQQILFTKSKGDTGANEIRVNIGGRYVQIADKKFKFADFKDAETKKDIIDTLQDVYQNINNKTLKSRFSEKFIEYYMDNGTLSTREWENYQTYLLSSKTPEGKSRKPLLTTNIDVPSEGDPLTHYAKYVKFHGSVDMPIIEGVKPPQSPDVQPKIIKVKDKAYNLDGQTVNVHTTPNGDISFIGKITDSNIDISIMEDEATLATLDTMQSNPKVMEQIYALYEQLKEVKLTALEKEENSEAILKEIQEIIMEKFFEQNVDIKKDDNKNNDPKPPTSTEFVLDGEAINSIDISLKVDGKDTTLPISFTANNSDGVADIIIPLEDLDNMSTIKAASEDPVTTKRKQIMVDANILDSSATLVEVAYTFIQGYVKGEVQKQISNNNDKGYNRPNRGNFRLFGANETDNQLMSAEDIEVFKEWHANNVSNIPYKVLEKLIVVNPTLRAWGVFEDGVAKFVKGGLRGTEYHEIFEGIWNGMLGEQEKTELLDEFRSSRGTFVDRETGKEYYKSDPTVSNQMIKERIADDFADWRLKKIDAKKLGKKQKAWYDVILDFFRKWFKKKNLKESLFEAIDNGRFKNATLNKSVYNLSPQYRIIYDSKGVAIKEEIINEYVEDMTAVASASLFSLNRKDSLFNYTPISKDRLFKNVYDYYDSKEISEIGSLGWEQLVERTTEKLATMGVRFNEDNEVLINEEETNAKEYIKDPFVVDAKETAPQAVKFLLSTLFKTKQTDNPLDGNPEPLLSKNIKGYQLIPYSKVFGTLIDKLANTSDKNEFGKKLGELALENNDFVRLFKKLGGKFDKKRPYIDFDSFNKYDWRLFSQFYQVFTKQFPDAIVQYTSEDEVYSLSINRMSSAKDLRKAWIDNMKLMANDESSIIFLDRPKQVYRIRPFESTINKISDNKFRIRDAYGKEHFFQSKPEAVEWLKINGIYIKSDSNKVRFLNSIGINYTLEDVKKMSKDDKKKFTSAVQALYKYLGKNNELMAVTGATLNVRGPILDLADIYIKINGLSKDSTHYGIDGKRRGNYSLDNAPSMLENDFSETKNVEELKELRPELNDVYSKNALLMKPGSQYVYKTGNWNKRIKVTYVQGTNNLTNNTTEVSSKLVLSDRFVQEINQNLNGNYYIIMPADSSTEWMVDMGNNITFKNVSSTRNIDLVGDIFLGYLEDEINLALDWKNRDYLQNLKGRAKQLRMFRELLPENMVQEIESKIAADRPTSEIMSFVNNNKSEIMNSVYDFVRQEASSIKDILLDSSKVIQTAEDTYSYNQLDSEFAVREGLNQNALAGKELDNILQYVVVNTAIANIEMHKVLFGDPYLFATKGNVTEAVKRIKSFLSPAKKMFDSPEYNNFLNKESNKAKDIALEENDYGYHKHKSYANTVVFNDVIIAGSLSNILSVYANTDVTDGFSWMSHGTYREVLNKNGQWSDEAEDFYQWEMAYTRNKLFEKGKYAYSSEALKKHDENLIKTEAPQYYLKVLKPIVRGAKKGKNHIDLAVDKFAQMPIFYSMVEGTNMEKLYIKMFEEKVDYALVRSARKIGVEQTHSLYNKDGSFNNDTFNNSAQIPWKIYSIQVETSHDGNKQQTRGSQLTKIASINLYDNGETVGNTPERKEHIDNVYAKNMQILDELHNNAYESLLNRLGIEELEDGWSFIDGKKVSDALVYEMLRREVNENTKDTVKLDENNQFRIPFEASPSYVQIKDIMYSMINKAILSPKMNGGAHVQVPSALFEKGRMSIMVKDDDGKWTKITRKAFNLLSAEEQSKAMLTSDVLKFYENEDGKRYAEILVPHWFKDKFKGMFNSDEELLEHLNKNLPEALSGIGFRIPSQALSSIEVFKVKGFLPQYMGATVVVPAEITTKTGGDFDIDKLNMYLKNVYIDENDKVKLVKVITKDNQEDYIDRQATKEYYAELFDKKLEKHKKSLTTALKKVSEKYTTKIDTTRSTLSGHQSEIDKILQEIYDEADLKNDRLHKKLATLSNKVLQEQLKIDFVDKMYKKALENEYFTSLEDMLTLEENFESLISPIGDGGYKATANKLISLKGGRSSKNQLISKLFLTKKRNAFALAKQWIGIAAVNITGLSNRQKSKVYFDVDRIENLTAYYKKWIGDGQIQLPHNTVRTDDGRTVLSISGSRTAEQQASKDLNFLSNRFSGFATATVDVATDDYILDVFPSGLLISTAMFMEAAGMGEKGRIFLNQPIILRYVQKLEYAQDKRLFNDENILDIKSEFPVSAEFDPVDNAIDLSKLEENISTYANSKDLSSDKMLKYNDQQLHILEEFLKYAVLGREMFLFNQATNYDTSKIRNGEEYLRKEFLTEKASETNLFSSVDDVMDNTFLGVQKDLMSKSVSMLSAVFKLDLPKFKNITNKVLKKYAERQFITQRDYTSIIQNIKISYLDYLIQSNVELSSEIDRLILDEKTNVAVKLQSLKERYLDLSILQDLEIEVSNRINGAQTVKLRNKDFDSYNDNYMIAQMRELRDLNDETKSFYEDLIKIAILQGSKRTSASIKHIIPIEDYSKYVTQVIDSIVPNQEVDVFAKGMFERNNFSNSSIMPVFTPKFLNVDVDINKRPDRNEDPVTLETEYFYTDIDTFPTIKQLGVKKNQRRVMVLNEKYNYKYVDEEFLKVPRIVVVNNKHENFRKEFYDVKEDKAISYAEYKHNKEKGDTSHYEYLGYQKVRMSDGNFLSYTDIKGNTRHVYKQINLLGEGRLLKEFYKTFKPSAVSNGSAVVKKRELTDAELLSYYGDKQKDLPKMKDEYSIVEMKKENRDKIKAGTKTITNRKEFIDNGTYALRDGSFVSLKLISKATIESQFGHPIVLFNNGSKMSVDEYAKKEGFESWEDFKKNGKYSESFIFNKQSRFIYNVYPVNLSEEEQAKAEEALKNQKASPVQLSLFDVNAERPHFDKLPEPTGKRTMTYAGIGSRRTPAEIQILMRQWATFLSNKGYTLNSGGAQGADMAFAGGTNKKNIFKSTDATDFTRAVAKEVHPNPKALPNEGPVLDLLARNTYQVFGEKLDTPVDFVLAYTPLTKEGKVVTKAEDRVYYGKNDPNNTGGTGQAIAMASMKGIPVINMADPKWEDQLREVLKQSENKPAEEKQDEFLQAAEEVQKQIDEKQSEELFPNKEIEDAYNNTPDINNAVSLDEYKQYIKDSYFDNVNVVLGNKRDIVALEDWMVKQGMIQEKDKRTEESFSKEYELFPGVYANKEQQEAIDGLKTFINDPNEDVISLVGRGGTGKTTIIKKITDSYQGGSVMYVAPTHKAKNILSQSVKKKAVTLASSLAIDLDETTGKFKPNVWKRSKFGIPIAKASLIVIDEGSMVNDNLFDELLREKKNGAKIIFMGDNVQLPPVGQKSDSKMFGLKQFKLIERMRQGEKSPIVPITDMLANNIESSSPVENAITDRTNKFTSTDAVIFTNNSGNFVNDFIDVYKRNPSNSRIITFNNQLNNNPQSVKSINNIIRNRLYPENPSQLRVNDQLMAYNSTVLDGGNESNPNKDIFNSNEYIVDEIVENNKTVKWQLTANSRAKGRRATPELEVSGQLVYLKDKITDKRIKDPIFIYDKKSLSKIRALQKNYIKMEDYQMNIKIDQVIPNLEFAYAITSHKSQGSTYDNVYVLEDNILQGNLRTNKEKNQSLYVATSRAKNRLVMHSVLNPNSEIQEHIKTENTPDTPKPPKQKGPEAFKIDNYNLTLNPDGRIFFGNGSEVTDKTIINKVKIAKEFKDGTLRLSVFNKSRYFVLSDNTILGAGATNKGKESVKDETIKAKILATASIYKKEC